MKRVILDTNFLLLPFSMKVDIFEELHRIMNEPFTVNILDTTIDELNKIITEQKGRDRDNAKMALHLLKEKNVSVIPVRKQKSLYMHPNSKEYTVDDSLALLADENTVIATQDKLLRERLFSKGVKVVILRGRKQLELRC